MHHSSHQAAKMFKVNDFTTLFLLISVEPMGDGLAGNYLVGKFC